MKLKQWLREYKQMTYAEYKSLPDMERWQTEGEFRCFNRAKQIHDNQNWRPMTDEEKEYYRILFEKERARYEENLKIGGVDGCRYTVLHYRWDY